MTSTRPESTVPDLADQVDINALLTSATSDQAPRVEIPPVMLSYFANERSVFATKTNRFRRTLVITNDALAKAILANRKADLKLTDVALHEAATKEFARQLRQFCADNKLSPAIDRNVNAVTFRMTPTRVKAEAAPVTVTTVETPAAE